MPHSNWNAKRAERLIERFNAIQEALIKVHGAELMFAASAAGWLMAIQYGAKESLKRIAKAEPSETSALIEELDIEHERMLRAFHVELCKYFQVDTEKALELSKHFEQVVHDICYQRG